MKSFCKSVKQTKMYMFIPNPAPRKANKESHPRMNAIMAVLFLSRYLLFPSSNSFTDEGECRTCFFFMMMMKRFFLSNKRLKFFFLLFANDLILKRETNQQISTKRDRLRKNIIYSLQLFVSLRLSSSSR